MPQAGPSKFVTKKFFSTCRSCGEYAFCRPVREEVFLVGFMTSQLCLWCRVNLKDEPWSCLATTIQHSANPKLRALINEPDFKLSR